MASVAEGKKRSCMEDVNSKRKKRKERLKSTHLKGYLEDVKKAWRMVSSFIRAAEEVVKVIRIYIIKSITS